MGFTMVDRWSTQQFQVSMGPFASLDRSAVDGLSMSNLAWHDFSWPL